VPLHETDSGRTSDAIERVAWQSRIFGQRLRRSDLTALEPTWPLRPVVISVVRNQPFELVARALPPFLAYAGLSAEFLYGPYDDSLSSLDHGVSADVDAVVLSLDFERYPASIAPVELASWLVERIVRLRGRTSAPVLVTGWPDRHPRADAFHHELEVLATGVPGAHLCDLRPVRDTLGDRFSDPRMEEVAGTSLSDQAQLQLARHIGLRYLPAVLAPPRKAIVVDLDNTLYHGVLGEDGPTGLIVTDAHRRLHKALLAWRARGLFLAVVSRNEPGDVAELFDTRHDLDLRPEHVSAWHVSWDAKSEAVARVAEMLRIDVDAVVVVDDNPGELAEIADAHGGIGAVLAEDPDVTTAAVGLYPGLFAFGGDASGTRRVDDLAAAHQRQVEQAAAADTPGGDASYLRGLDMRLAVAVDPGRLVPRLSELSNRTNQLNTAFLRLDEVAVATYIERFDCSVAAVTLGDRFSDSGVIGAVFARMEASGTLVLDEIDISCRALGRGLETLIVSEALRRIASVLAPSTITIEFRAGPRNEPARRLLVELTGQRVPDHGRVPWPWSAELADTIAGTFPVTVTAQD